MKKMEELNQNQEEISYNSYYMKRELREIKELLVELLQRIPAKKKPEEVNWEGVF